MKKKDIKKILAVIALSVVVSFFISSFLFSDPGAEPMQVRFAEPIVSDFPRPSEDYFNEESVNPTRLIIIGEEVGNVAPFVSQE